MFSVWGSFKNKDLAFLEGVDSGSLIDSGVY